MPFASPFWTPADADAILFDWDGVIADTRLDFSAIHKKYYGDRPAMLLEDAASLVPEVRASLMRELRELEVDGALRARPVCGALEVIDWVRRRGLPWAVVSRNCRESIEAAAAACGFELPPLVRSRDDGTSVKPDPRALTETCAALGAEPAQTLFIGDYIYDMIGARRAAMRGVLIKAEPAPEWEPWLECSFGSMRELQAALSEQRPITPWEYRGVEGLEAVFAEPAEIGLGSEPDMPSRLLAEAGAGHGLLIVPDAELTPDLWRANPGFDPRFMGMRLEDASRALVAARFPFARVEARPHGAG